MVNHRALYQNVIKPNHRTICDKLLRNNIIIQFEFVYFQFDRQMTVKETHHHRTRARNKTEM